VADIGDENAGCAPAQIREGNFMRRHPEPHPFDERLNAEKARIEAVLESTDPGRQRDLLELRLRRIDTALHIDGWVSSMGLQPPTLG
jgi:hypothetical protein